MSSVLTRSRLTLSCFALSFVFAFGEACAQFTTILNIPPDPNIGDHGSIGSDTQLNLFDGGMIGGGFDAGLLFDIGTNLEVNISGGSAGKFFAALSGSTVNISGGSVGDSFSAESGSTINISGGEFRLNGVLVDGLAVVGDTLAFDLPDDSVLSGTLADGTPFAFSVADRNEYFNEETIADGTLTLEAAALPAIGPAMITLPGDPAPLGIRAGQTLLVDVRGVLGDDFNAGQGSMVTISGGEVGDNLEAAGAQINISAGSVGDSFDAFSGSTVNISGGSVGDSFASIGSTVTISGGSVNSLYANDGSLVNMTGGSIGDYIRASDGSTVNIAGGEVGIGFLASDSSTVNISGGSFDNDFRVFGGTVDISGGSFGDNFDVFDGSEVNLLGTQVLLDGFDITDSLALNEPFTVIDRDVTLSGLLADGSVFAFDLNSTQSLDQDFFDPSATLTITLVPMRIAGDTNWDGAVNIDDLNNVRNNFGATGSVDGSLAGDAYPFDGRVDLDDLNAVRNNFGFVAAAVPEPSAAVLALLGVFVIVLRRRQASAG